MFLCRIPASNNFVLRFFTACCQRHTKLTLDSTLITIMIILNIKYAQIGYNIDLRRRVIDTSDLSLYLPPYLSVCLGLYQTLSHNYKSENNPELAKTQCHDYFMKSHVSIREWWPVPWLCNQMSWRAEWTWWAQYRTIHTQPETITFGVAIYNWVT